MSLLSALIELSVLIDYFFGASLAGILGISKLC
jgi:hypothetical protein